MTIIKTFSELSELNRRDLFKKRGDKIILKSMNPKRAVSIARLLADGFENADLRKDPTKSQYRRAQDIIKEYYTYARDKKSKLVRPSKANRGLYSDISSMNKNFKVYLVPVENKDNKFIVKKNKKTGKKTLSQVGKYITYNYIYFKDQKALAVDITNEAKKIYKKAQKIRGKKQIRIMVGRHLSNGSFSDEKQLTMELERYGTDYSNYLDFLKGVQVVTFKNQK